ncbi:MAG: hypothetical protein Q8922_09895 [Bacteroidota bacterium]|nr:hypothetical protein [Bacteroidota bacterium]MDP4232867.1 hypothetical protein [Bacteroidota bacterium]MDP4241911.1 hypothetical protein [Bacteroidota bacterium]MDP4288236.1 hypothetical protein [Bacteroidota bacterium]
MVGKAAMDAARPHHDRDRKGRISLKKRANLTPSVPIRLEGFAVFVLIVVVLVFFYDSLRTIYIFPVPDSYRWYGDETQTWMLLGWKNLLAHGRLTLPIALGSTLEHAPGLLLGSSWVPAVIYGLPQLILSADIDPITIGRTVTMCFALTTVVVMSWAGFRMRLPTAGVMLSLALLLTTPSFTFASHSARYDMMTGFAIVTFVALFAVRIPLSAKRARPTRLFAFWLGLGSMFAALTISPHLLALLFLPALYTAWYFGVLRTRNGIFSFLGGGAIAIAVLIGAYMAANQHVSIGGALFQHNQAGSYLSNLPIVHPFSWSAQSHQLWAKGYYLSHEAMPFAVIFPLLLISSILLLVFKRLNEQLIFVTLSLAGVVVGAIYFQSTLPYYLIHLLPLAALTLAVHLNAWRDELWMRPLIAAASLALAAQLIFVSIPELRNAGRMGKRINEANTTAVQAAIEQESRVWQADLRKPLVLAQGPAVHELLRNSTIRLMTESFLFFPERDELPDSTIAREGVNYIIDYNRPMTTAYQAAVRTATPIFARSGTLLDRTVDYFHDTTSEIDTLTLYQVTRNGPGENE